MTAALLYLTTCSVVNRVRVRLRRLKQPRYLAGTVVGVAYVYFFLIRRPPRASMREGAEGVPWMVTYHDVVEPIAGAGLLLLAILTWVLASASRPALAFSPSEIQFLFTAPVTRRALVHYKLLGAQLPAFITSIIVTLIARPGAGRGWIVFGGTLLVMITAKLYAAGTWLSRESLRRHGRAGVVRSAAPLALLGVALVVAVTASLRSWPELTTAASAADLAAAIRRLGASWPVRVALLPFTTLLGPVLAAGPAEAARALLPAAGVTLLTYVWAIRSDVAFEEASAAHAERAARQPRDRMAPRAPRSTRVPFELAAQGRPEAAVIWKNLISLGRYGSIRTVVSVLAAVVGVGFVVAQGAGGFAAGLARLAAFAAGVTVFFGPQITRNDLRQDLAQLAVLKSWPVRGAALLRGEVLGPTVFLSAIALVLLVAAAPLSAPLAARWHLGAWDRVSYTLAAFLIASGLILTQVVFHNAMALFFPAWVQMLGRRSRGVDALGQQLLMMAGLVVALALAVVPAGLAALFAGAVCRVTLGVVPVLIPAAVGAAVLVVQNAIVVESLGSVMDRTDVSALDPVE
jgi:hypothetical protein